jgi:hypothetical protein
MSDLAASFEPHTPSINRAVEAEIIAARNYGGGFHESQQPYLLRTAGTAM